MSLGGKTIGRFFDLQKKVYEKCLYPGFGCERKAIRAHSIQNGKILDLLQANNHVVMPLQKLSENDEPVTVFSQIGRNNASTFTGLCAEHDTELFKLADTQPLDLKNTKQLVELAYRAVMREVHTRVEWACRHDHHRHHCGSGHQAARIVYSAPLVFSLSFAVLLAQLNLTSRDRKLVANQTEKPCNISACKIWRFLKFYFQSSAPAWETRSRKFKASRSDQALQMQESRQKISNSARAERGFRQCDQHLRSGTLRDRAI